MKKCNKCMCVKGDSEMTKGRGGKIANDIETLLLRNLKAEYNNPEDRFHGWTETFLNVDRIKLINQLKELSYGCH